MDWTKEKLTRSLKQHPNLIGCDSILDELLDLGRSEFYQSGDFLAAQGDQGSGMWFLLSGSVEIIVKGHPYKIRIAGEVVGEMAVIDPQATRSADIVCNANDTHAFFLSDDDFFKLAQKEVGLFQALCRLLGDRLRQRDQFFVPPNEKPSIFVASSGEARSHLEKICDELADDPFELTPWTKKGIFRPSSDTFGELVQFGQQVDFAIIIVTTDDLGESRDEDFFMARDNVWLELGLFVGSLGRYRTFIVTENDINLKIPSDLFGITRLVFNDIDELVEVVDLIRQQVQEHGVIHRLRRSK